MSDYDLPLVYSNVYLSVFSIRFVWLAFLINLDGCHENVVARTAKQCVDCSAVQA